MALQFKLDGIDGQARATTVTLAHGSYTTPVFMPVGTKGCIKGVSSLAMESSPIDCEILLGNTYHLADHPGAELLEGVEGLHKFMNYSRNILTDSGGFQMVSLLKLAEISEEGVNFSSPVDGSKMMLTPEESIRTQHKIGSDIIMMLDDVVHSCQIDMKRYAEATERTVRWLDRCIKEHLEQKAIRYKHAKNLPLAGQKRKLGEQARSERQMRIETGYQREPALFAILQGWLDCKPGGLRARCLDKFLKPDKEIDVSAFSEKEKELLGLDQAGVGTSEAGPVTALYNRDHYIDGYAIGGLAGGESKEQFIEVVHFCCTRLPPGKPRYLMGVGYPVDVVVSVCHGVDMFDCVYPTRTARFGTAFTRFGLAKLKQAKNGIDLSVVDDQCPCTICTAGYSRAVLHYLLKMCPSTASCLITHHNIVYMLQLTKGLRKAILNKTMTQFVQQFFREYFRDEPVPKWCIDALATVGISLQAP